MLHGTSFGSRPDGWLDPRSRGSGTSRAAGSVRDTDQDLSAGRVHARHAVANRHNPRTDGASSLAGSVHHEPTDGAPPNGTSWDPPRSWPAITASVPVPSLFVPSPPAPCWPACAVIVDAYLFERAAAGIAGFGSPVSAVRAFVRI